MADRGKSGSSGDQSGTAGDDDRSELAIAGGAVLVIAVAALLPALAAGAPANQVPVHESADPASLANPGGSAWSDLESTTIALSSAPSGVPDAADTSVGSVTVTAAHADERLFVRLSWPDETANDSVADPRAFADAAAVQMPANVTTDPAIAMGSPRTPVNVWYWSAANHTEELLAGGPGTTTHLSPSAIATNATHEDGRWRVVFQRALVPEEPNRTAIRMDHDVAVAFGVWDGANMERSGRKAVSEWHTFPVGPPPQGPPYETVLWAIAGLAILVVVLVTAMAVRRTRSGGGPA